MLSRSFIQKELLLNQLKHKKLLPQIQFATLTHDNQIKFVHYPVKYETVLPSQKDEYPLTTADFGNNKLSISINDKGENIIVKLSFEAVKPF